MKPQVSLPHRSSRGHYLLLFILGALIFILVQNQKQQAYSGDARFNLMGAQSLLQHQTLNLRPLLTDPRADPALGEHWGVLHDTYESWMFFPPGPSLAALPFVAAANGLGMNMVYPDDDARLQLILCGLGLMILLYQFYRISLYWLAPDTALVMSLGGIMSTLVISTCGTAFWTHNVQLIAVTAVFQMLLAHRYAARRIPLWQLVLACFFIWASRPSGLILNLLFLGWIGLFVRERKALLLIAGLGGMALFLLFNKLVLGVWLPHYYNTGARPLNDYYGHALYYLTLGPSRGFWVYCPGFLIIWLGWLHPALRRDPVFWLGMGGIVVLTLLMARYAEWSGGWSFGPRLLVDAVPGCFVAFCMVMGRLHTFPLLSRLHSAPTAGVIGLLLAGAWIHSYQGLFNPDTLSWHNYTTHDQGYHDGWGNWHYPQFLATADRNSRFITEMEALHAMHRFQAAVPPGATVFYREGDASRYSVTRKGGYSGTWATRLSNPDELKAHGPGPVYAPEWEEAVVKAIPGARISEIPPAEHLGFRLAHLPRSWTLLLACKDEASLNLHPSTRDSLLHRKSGAAQLGFRHAWAAVFHADTLVAEKTDSASAVSLVWEDWTLESAGYEAGNAASIRQGTQEHCLNLRGINVVVLDHNRKIVSTAAFDTFKRDGRPPEALKISF